MGETKSTQKQAKISFSVYLFYKKVKSKKSDIIPTPPSFKEFNPSIKRNLSYHNIDMFVDMDGVLVLCFIFQQVIPD